MMEPQRKRRCSLDSIEIAVEESAKRLGYALLKEEQRLAIRKFVESSDVFISLLDLVIVWVPAPSLEEKGSGSS